MEHKPVKTTKRNVLEYVLIFTLAFVFLLVCSYFLMTPETMLMWR